MFVLEKVQVAICDNEKRDTKLLTDLLKHSGLYCDIDCFSDAKSLLFDSSFSKYALFILNLDICEMHCVTLANKIRETCKDCRFVFITKSKDHALDAFRADAMQYLVKPLKEQDVIRTIDQYIRLTGRCYIMHKQ